MTQTTDLTIPAQYARMADALEDPEARASLEAGLPDLLRGQRWFGGGARQLTATRIERWAPVDAAGASACLCIVSATDTAGARTEHALWLLAGEPVGADLRIRPVTEALESEAVRAEALRLALSGAELRGHDAALVGEPTGADTPGCEGPGRLMGVEQSNTSIVYGAACFLKTYRRLEHGPNPEVEMTRYLTAEAGFAAAPRVFAVGRLEGADGYSADVLMVQAYVSNYGDGWTWAVEAARRALVAAPAPNSDVMHEWLQTEQDTLQAAASLGTITAQMHAALARATGEGMSPAPVTDADFELWNRTLQRESRPVAATMESFPQTIAPVSFPNAGLKTRVHGDYHLGQVLRTDDGFVVVDFEGEPARPLRDRRSLQHPLVDVAGMLRSWNYAALTASHELDSTAGRGITVDEADEWESIVRYYFLESYWAQASIAEPAFLPADRVNARRLLTFFELRKALYEVQYERSYRPDWAWIPETAVRNLVTNLSA